MTLFCLKFFYRYEIFLLSLLALFSFFTAEILLLAPLTMIFIITISFCVTFPLPEFIVLKSPMFFLSLSLFMFRYSCIVHFYCWNFLLKETKYSAFCNCQEYKLLFLSSVVEYNFVSNLIKTHTCIQYERKVSVICLPFWSANFLNDERNSGVRGRE